MSGQRFVLPYETVIDSTGVPLPGALLYFYESGTSTPATTYSDQALTVPNANPVVAGSGGRFSNIFLDPSVTYKVVLEDADGVQQWAADPVTAPGANSSVYTTYANIAALRAATAASPTPLVYVQAYSSSAPTGAGWFAYVASDHTSTDNGGTIIVDAASNRYYRLYSGPCPIDNFGAVADSGITDNASAINAALTACADVLVPSNTSGAWYGFASTLTLRAGRRLSGQGKASLLKANAAFGTGAPLLQNATTNPANAGARDDGITVENLTIDANSQGNANLSLVAAVGFRVRNLRLLNGSSSGLLIGANVSNAAVFSQNGWVEDLYVYSCQGPGIAVTGASEVEIVNPVVDTCAIAAATQAAILLQAAATTSTGRNLKLVEPIVRNSGGAATAYGILVDGAGSSAWSEIEVLGGSVDAQTGAGLGYRDVADLQVVGLHVNAPSAQGVAKLTSGGAVGVTGLLLSAVKVKGAGSDGFYLYNDSYALLSGCYARACGRDGVRLDGTTAHTDITGAVLTGNTGYGVNEANASVDNTRVTGGKYTGNTAGIASLQGAHSYTDAVFIGGPYTLAINQTVSNIAHGLGQTPNRIDGYLVCLTADIGYNVGDRISISSWSVPATNNRGVTLWAPSGKVNVAYSVADVVVTNPSTYASNSITYANWAFYIVAKGAY